MSAVSFVSPRVPHSDGGDPHTRGLSPPGPTLTRGGGRAHAARGIGIGNAERCRAAVSPGPEPDPARGVSVL
eukprot:scaffold77175_cov53-Phaeocystis_antarctica.AAC.4